MTKYSLETKLAAIHAYLDGVESFQVTAQKHNVNAVMLKKWVAKFRKHGLAGLQKGYTDYSIEFKMKEVSLISWESWQHRTKHSKT